MREQADYLGKSHRKKMWSLSNKCKSFLSFSAKLKSHFSRLWYASFLLVEGPFDKMVQIIC